MTDGNPRSLLGTSIKPCLAVVDDFYHYPKGWQQQLQAAWLPIAIELATTIRSGRSIIGVHGGQGSGKSTLSQALVHILAKVYRLKVVVLSLDDFYLAKSDRQQLANSIHPLLATRGVPGTHDTNHLKRCITELLAADDHSPAINLPIFNKLSDDREQHHRRWQGACDAILLEGWCIGVPPQSTEQLVTASNELERQEDPQGTWRNWVNRQLKDHYQSIFDRLDCLLMLQVPGMEQIINWRIQQEHDNRHQSATTSPKGMTDDEIHRFVQHYERLTRWALQTLPNRADILVTLDKTHAVSEVICRDFRS